MAFNIYNYSPWGLNQQTYQISHLGAPHCHQRVGSEFIPWKPWLRNHRPVGMTRITAMYTPTVTCEIHCIGQDVAGKTEANCSHPQSNV